MTSPGVRIDTTTRPAATRTSGVAAVGVIALCVALVAGACGHGGHRRSATPVHLQPTTTVATTAPVTIPSTAPGAVPKLTLDWKPCQPAGFQCATVTPPLDYDHIDGRTVNVAVTRRPATGPANQRIGSLFVNPGGPGASAVAFAAGVRSVLPASLLARFDLIAFDPRGTDGSEPIACEDGPSLDRYFAVDPTPDNPAEHQALLDANRTFATDCAARNGDRLAHVDTKTVARDWDLIRDALGEDKVTYLGFSYGTFLGATYADLFPNRVRAFVLDGAIDPTLAPDEVNHEQAVGFEHELDAFFADCAAKPTCAFSPGADPQAAFDRLSASVDAHPIAAAHGRTLGPGEFVLGVIAPLYRKSEWPALADALGQASAGKGDALLALADEYTERQANGSYAPLLSANTAVNCIDRPWPKDTAAYDAEAAQFVKDAPHFGAALALGGTVCAFWPFPPVDQPRVLRATGAPPIVVVGTTGDPATPFQWAQALASQLEHGVLLTHVGDGHTAFSSGNKCILNAETAYLLTLAPPAKGTTCAD